MGVEGIVSKRRDMPYRPVRFHGWRKIRCPENRRETSVVRIWFGGGWTLNQSELLWGNCRDRTQLFAPRSSDFAVVAALQLTRSVLGWSITVELGAGPVAVPAWPS
jgi:hypothetical protein